jgi:anti-sigma regulatory factor (Ser/Thr protein kinase)
MITPSQFEMDGTRAGPPALRIELRRDLRAPALARAAASSRCDALELSAAQCHTLMLLVSEVVSNAVLHSQAPPDTPIVLTTSVTEDAIHVTVADFGEGFFPQPREPGAARGGYGLYLLEKVARRWGVDHVGGTRVWFELSRAADAGSGIRD